MPESSFLVGEWRVDLDLNQLSRGEETKVLVPKVMSLLSCLVRHAGQPVSQEQIFAEVWPNQIVADSSLYQAIAQLRKALGDDGKQKLYIERISGKGYRLVAKVKPVAKPVFRFPFSRTILLVVTILLGLGVTSWLMQKETVTDYGEADDGTTFSIAQIDSIAFIRLSLDEKVSAESNQLSALNDVLLTQLMHINGLRVLSLHTNQSEIDASAILKGNISAQGDKVRVYLQLQRVDNHQVVWAKFFEGDNKDLFGLQDLVVADLLQLFRKRQLVTTFASSQVDSRTFDQYLLARHFWEQRTADSLEQSREILEKIQLSQKSFPLATVALCETYHFLYLYSDWSLQKAVDQCEPLLEQTLKTQPDLGQALAAKALLLSSQGERQAAEKLFAQAVKQAPNYALGFAWYGNLVRDLGQYSESLALNLKAYRLAPMSPIINRSLAYSYLNLRQVENADYYYQRAIALEPGYFNRAVSDLDFFSLTSDRASRFLNWAKQNPKILAREPNYQLTQAQVWLALGENEKVSKRLASSAPSQLNPSFELYVRASLKVAQGDYSQAAELLRQRREIHRGTRRFDMPYVETLIYSGQLQQAQKIFLNAFPEFKTNAIKIESSNVYLAMFYLQLLNKLESLDDWQGIIQAVDQQIADKEYPKNFYVAQWLAFRGQVHPAKSMVLDMMRDGWLPDTNAELFALVKMRQLFVKLGVAESEFNALLALNVSKVKQR